MSGSASPIFNLTVQQLLPASLTVGAPAPLGAYAPSTMPPSTIYTAAGAIAPSDRLSVINNPAIGTYSVAAGTTDGQLLTICNVGVGAATIEGPVQGGIQSVTQYSALRLAWSAALTMWLRV